MKSTAMYRYKNCCYFILHIKKERMYNGLLKMKVVCATSVA